MKIRLTAVYDEEGTDEDLEYLQSIINEGNQQGIDEFFGIGWNAPVRLNILEVKKNED
jgi:hypothetical protein